MNNEDFSSGGGSWLDTCGLSYILRTLALALDPTKLVVALVAIILTFGYVRALDAVWPAAATAVVDGSGAPVPPCIGDAWGCGGCAAGMAMCRTLAQRPCLAVFLAIGCLFIWSVAGGMLCRLTAIQFATDRRPDLTETLGFVLKRFWGGFLLAPCFPLIVALLIAGLMALAGVVLRVPVVGDGLGALIFPLALLGGFVLSCMLAGLVTAGHLFWPAVAVEGSDALDAFSRGMAYTFWKPWMTAWYAATALVFGAICWTVAYSFTFLVLWLTRGVVAFGTSPFGWWQREGESKLTLMWPSVTCGNLHAWPDWGKLGFFECIAAGLIGLTVLLAIALLWSFITSLYFSATTTIYFLLRRDVDAIDLTDINEGDEGDIGLAHVEETPTTDAEAADGEGGT